MPNPSQFCSPLLYAPSPSKPSPRQKRQCSTRTSDQRSGNHLERQPRLDLLLQSLGNDAVKLGEDLHGELRVDALLADQLVQGVRQGDTEATEIMSAKRPLVSSCAQTRMTPKGGRSTFHADTNRNSYLKGLPCCLVLSPLVPGGLAATWL